jgi:hypothetical protein
MLRGWLSFPLGRGLRLGVSSSRTWLSFPIFRGIRGGVSVPLRKRRAPRRIAAETPSSYPTKSAAPRNAGGEMPGAMAYDSTVSTPATSTPARPAQVWQGGKFVGGDKQP